MLDPRPPNDGQLIGTPNGTLLCATPFECNCSASCSYCTLFEIEVMKKWPQGRDMSSFRTFARWYESCVAKAVGDARIDTAEAKGADDRLTDVWVHTCMYHYDRTRLVVRGF